MKKKKSYLWFTLDCYTQTLYQWNGKAENNGSSLNVQWSRGKWVNKHCHLLKNIYIFLNGTKLCTGGSISANTYVWGTNFFRPDLIICFLQSLSFFCCQIQAERFSIEVKSKSRQFSSIFSIRSLSFPYNFISELPLLWLLNIFSTLKTHLVLIFFFKIWDYYRKKLKLSM